MDILGQPDSRWASRGRTREGGQRQKPSPSFSRHQRSHTESGPCVTLHVGEKRHSTWQGRGEMGLEGAVLGRQEA